MSLDLNDWPQIFDRDVYMVHRTDTMICDVRRILAEFPELGAHGFGTDEPVLDHDFVYQQVAPVRQWLEASPERAAALLRRGDSYRIKHEVENAIGIYVSNGALIVAAALAGYPPVRIKKNAVFRSRTS